VCLFLLSLARRPVLENWVRPLLGPRSVLRVPRDVQYFADMTEWNVRPAYERAASLLASHHCRTVGIDSTVFQLEYPLMALLRERRPGTVFLHTGVANASGRYPQPVAQSPCAVVCLNCADDPKRAAIYSSLPHRTGIGKFFVFEQK
jgi:hypothetical protein